MSLYRELQNIDGERLFDSFATSVPALGDPASEIEEQTRIHLSKMEHFPSIMTYIREYGAWTLRQVENGELTRQDAQMLLMGAMSTAAALADYALGRQNSQET